MLPSALAEHRRSPALTIIAGTITVVGVCVLGWFAGRYGLSIFTAIPILPQREHPGLLIAVLLAITSACSIAAAVLIHFASRSLARRVGTQRAWAIALWIAFTAAAIISIVAWLYQAYLFRQQWG